jgi:hypothetical protein
VRLPEEIKTEKPVEELLASACPSIQYRIRREILGESDSSSGMQALEAQIMQDEAVRGIIQSQGQDGWIGRDFHGYDSMEAGIRLLCEKGLRGESPPLRQALRALEAGGGRLDRGLGKVGEILEAQGFDGKYRIAAALFASAGVEETPLVQKQIEAALEEFRGVLRAGEMDEIARPHKDKLVFQPGVKWAGIYSLRLLAHTHGWRVPKEREMVAEAVRKLVKLSPMPDIHILYKSQLVAPAGFGMQDFNPEMDSMSPAGWMMWFQRMELCARLGITEEVPELRAQVYRLRGMLAENEGWFTKQLRHDYFKHWGAYTGLMLETDWRNPQRRIYDLTFRSLLILHYSGRGRGNQ